MKIRIVNTIEELLKVFDLDNIGKIYEKNINIENNECDKNSRKLRDAEVLTTISANSPGNALEIGTSYGHGTFKIATNIQQNIVHTVNFAPEQVKSSQKNITHVLKKDEIGSFYKQKGLKNIQQHYADTLDWAPPHCLENLGMAFIDGCHDSHAVLNDSRIAYNRLQNGGFLIWHDFNPELRAKYNWIDQAMSGVENFMSQYGISSEIVHLKNSWMGVIRKKESFPNITPSKNIKMGIVIKWKFHEQRQWVCALTPYLVESLRQKFDTIIIESQQEYEDVLSELDTLISFEPGWGAPVLEYSRTSALKNALEQIPSYIFFSDPHANKWREDYFLNSGISKIASFYYHPLKTHFTKIPSEKIFHFPWAIPDNWISHDKITFKNNKKISCFGGSKSDAYELRNWCRSFPFVQAAYNSGCENKVMSDKEYFKWLSKFDAAIAAGSDNKKYLLTMPKYFEIAASGALLFGQKTNDLPMLGFRHMENCIIFTRDNFESLCLKYLKQPEKYLKIREKGQNLIKEKHLISNRLHTLEKDISCHKKKLNISVNNTREKQCSSTCQKKNISKSEKIIHCPIKKSVSEKKSTNENRLTSWYPNKNTNHVLKVAVFYDLPGWAWWHRANNLKKYLPKNINITPIKIGDHFKINDYSFFLVFDYYVLDRIPYVPSEKIILGCSCPKLLRSALSLYTKKSFAGLIVNNKIMFDLCEGHHNIFLCQNGVDTNFFIPSKYKHEKIIACWIGNSSSMGEKGLDIIKAACDLTKTELIILDRNKNDTIYPQKWIIDNIYHKASVYLNASKWEGTPNPALEAMSCGLPVISTSSGNMPEIIIDGYNGFIAERNVESFAKALIHLKHLNIHNLSINARKSIEKDWSWENQIMKYEKMFRELYIHKNKSHHISTKNNTQINKYKKINGKLFQGKNKVYLASADRMDRTLLNCEQIRQAGITNIHQFATVIGGLSGLNYIPHLNPENLLFFDVNQQAIQYCKLIIELIRISSTPDEFISRVFSRSTIDFQKKHKSRLNYQNQKKFINQQVDNNLRNETLQLLSTASLRATYKNYIDPHIPGKVLTENCNCRVLLPCWPITERVPVGVGTGKGYNDQGKLVPNTNTFFYGYGWLGSKSMYLSLKKNISNAKIKFQKIDILDTNIENLIIPSRSLVMHTSNIDDWFPEKWQNMLPKWINFAHEMMSDLTIITSHNSIKRIHPDPHCSAYEAILPHVEGQIVEVTHKADWGFKEIIRKNITATDYLQGTFPADTTILHILIGEGISIHNFKKILKLAIHQSKKVIILEHNKDSKDLRNNKQAINLDGLKSILNKLRSENKYNILKLNTVRGVNDSRRNILAILAKI